MGYQMLTSFYLMPLCCGAGKPGQRDISLYEFTNELFRKCSGHDKLDCLVSVGKAGRHHVEMVIGFDLFISDNVATAMSI